MKNQYSAKHFIFFIVLLSCCNLVPCTQTDVIDETCSKTPDPDFCATILRSDPRSDSADIKGLAGIMLDTVLVLTTETLNSIQDELSRAEDIPTKRALAFCAETYTPLVKFNIPQGIGFFKQGKYGIVEYTMKYDGEQFDKCGKKLKPPSSVLHDNNLVEDLTQIARGILQQLL